jgi:RNA polymerase sigma-70 factor (ECF subfamily)
MLHDEGRRREVTVADADLWARRFERERDHLRSLAYRMLGSFAEADDAVQEAWLRLRRTDPATVRNLTGWLTAVVARICLDVLRARRAHPELSLDLRLPDPLVLEVDRAGPEEEALRADAVGLALLVVLETLSPAERIAFVLHDLFGVPFGEVAPVVGRTPSAARQLASRARRRVRGATTEVEPDRARQRKVVDAFLAAARGGNLEALVALLDPGVVLRADAGAGRYRGRRDVAAQAAAFASRAAYARPVWVNGSAGFEVTVRGRTIAVLGFTVVHDRIAQIVVYAEPHRFP